MGTFLKQVGGKGAGFGVVFEGLSQRGELIALDESAAKVNRLRSKQGNRTPRFEDRGDQFVKLIAAQGLSPTMPEFTRRFHDTREYSIVSKAYFAAQGCSCINAGGASALTLLRRNDRTRCDHRIFGNDDNAVARVPGLVV